MENCFFYIFRPISLVCLRNYLRKHKETEQAKRSTQDKSGFAALVDRVVASATPW